MPKLSKAQLSKTLQARIGAANLKKLERPVIAIAGVGGIGSFVALLLAKTGIENFIIADKDEVSLSDINRQAYSLNHVGKPKTKAIAQIIKQVNPYAKITAFNGMVTKQTVKKIFGGADILIEGFDSPKAKAMLLTSFLKECPGKPVITACGVVGFESCSLLRQTTVADNLYAVGDMENECSAKISLAAPRVAASAGMMANLAVRIILGLE